MSSPFFVEAFHLQKRPKGALAGNSSSVSGEALRRPGHESLLHVFSFLFVGYCPTLGSKSQVLSGCLPHWLYPIAHRCTNNNECCLSSVWAWTSVLGSSHCHRGGDAGIAWEQQAWITFSAVHMPWVPWICICPCGGAYAYQEVGRELKACLAFGNYSCDPSLASGAFAMAHAMFPSQVRIQQFWRSLHCVAKAADLCGDTHGQQHLGGFNLGKIHVAAN